MEGKNVGRKQNMSRNMAGQIWSDSLNKVNVVVNLVKQQDSSIISTCAGPAGNTSIAELRLLHRAEGTPDV